MKKINLRNKYETLWDGSAWRWWWAKIPFAWTLFSLVANRSAKGRADLEGMRQANLLQIAVDAHQKSVLKNLSAIQELCSFFVATNWMRFTSSLVDCSALS